MAKSVTTRRYRKERTLFRAQCARDGVVCWLCHQPIDYTITDTTDDQVFELDHLFPQSTHFELAEDPGNFRASHRACNRVRGNKQGGAQLTLGKTSRQW